MNKEENHYQVLGVDPSASMKTIAQAYRKQALVLHPDRNSDPHATEMFKVLQKAYETLANEVTRNEYNANMDLDDNDDDDDNDVIFGKHSERAQLQMGKKWSENYSEKIITWSNEYERLNIQDNFHEELSTVLSATLKQFDDYFDINGKINNYNVCQTCKQSFLNLDDHQYQVTQPYKKLFEVSQNASVSKNAAIAEIDKQLKKSIKSNTWDWMPCVLPTDYAYIWSSSEWQCIKTMIDQMQEPIRIVQSTSLIDRSNIYIDDNSDNYRQCERVILNLIGANRYQYLPDRTIIEEVESCFSSALYSNLKSLNITKMATETRVPLFDKTMLSYKYQQLLSGPINADDFYYIVQNPSQVIPNNSQTNCHDCGKKFNIFRHRYYCQVCGVIQCSDCQRCESVPHLGYIGPVKICKTCADEKLVIAKKTIYNCLKQAIQIGTSDCLNIYLALLQQYTTEDLKSYYRQTGEHFFQLQNYSLGLQCYYYARIEYNELLNIIAVACLQQNYSLGVTCIDVITKLYGKDREFLHERFTEYCTLATSSINDSYNNALISLLFDMVLKLNSEYLLLKCIALDEANKYDACLLYLLYIKSKNNASIDWKKIGQEFLQKHQLQLALFCFDTAKLSIDKWIQHLDLLCSQSQYSTVATILTLINQIMHKNLVKVYEIQNPIVSHLGKILLSTHAKLEDWINYAVLLMKQNAESIKIIWCLVFIHIQFGNNWKNLKINYHSQRKREHVLLCNKMEQILDKNDGASLQFSGDIFQTNQSFAMEILNMLNIEWETLGNYYFNEKKYEQALNCYLKSNSDNINK
ncbi:unnamed protein product [Rotaria socialis]|uniref:Uncharacterized protein n=1 Tax=Rotaria socialis TaxID=392032 RepID=A0A817ZKT3_9BILA|nr:unnamed protein product [Rotaria socialis]CAF4651776.1 unnamed protein product [Rotaria socialis]